MLNEVRGQRDLEDDAEAELKLRVGVEGGERPMEVEQRVPVRIERRTFLGLAFRSRLPFRRRHVVERRERPGERFVPAWLRRRGYEALAVEFADMVGPTASQVVLGHCMLPPLGRASVVAPVDGEPVDEVLQDLPIRQLSVSRAFRPVRKRQVHTGLLVDRLQRAQRVANREREDRPVGIVVELVGVDERVRLEERLPEGRVEVGLLDGDVEELPCAAEPQRQAVLLHAPRP